MFAMVLFCKLLAMAVPTFRWMPAKRKAAAVVLVVHAAPPAPGVLPPMKLFDTTKLLPRLLLM